MQFMKIFTMSNITESIFPIFIFNEQTKYYSHKFTQNLIIVELENDYFVIIIVLKEPVSFF